MHNQDDLQLILQVARLYYEQRLTQQEIADRLNLTRQKVSRLLDQAHQEGIVRITIHDPTLSDTLLEQKIKQTFGLNDVILVTGKELPTDKLRTAIGMAAGRYLAGLVKEDARIGISWGRTLYEMVNALPPGGKVNLQVIPLIGGIGGMGSSFQVNEISRRFAEAFGGSYRLIYVPAFTQDIELWNALMRTSEVKEVKELWQRLDMAVVGIGHVELQKNTSMFFKEYISPATLAELEARGAVGDICGHFFDVDGKLVTVGADVISIGLQQLKKVPLVIAVAGGIEKTRAILGALRGGYIKILISDTVTARAVLQENASQ